MHVLIMTESWQAALACIQSFGRRGHHVSVLHSNRLSPHVYSKFIKNKYFFEGETGTRSERAHTLLALLRAESVDLVIPISDEDTHLLAECSAIAPMQKGVICPNIEVIETVRDREKTMAFCRKNGIRVPESIQVFSQSALREAALKLGFPVVIKKSYSVASQGVEVIYSVNDMPDLEAFFLTGGTLQVQKFIQGEFVGIVGFGWQGQLVRSFSFNTAYEYSHGGTPPYIYSEEAGESTVVLTKIIEYFNWSGGIDLDFMRDASGQLYLLEINPRLSGTTIFPLKLGIDLPLCYEAALGDFFDTIPQAPAINHPVLFISAPDEIRLTSANPHENFKKSMEIRQKFSCVDSLFFDDHQLILHQFSHFLQIAWFTPRIGA